MDVYEQFAAALDAVMEASGWWEERKSRVADACDKGHLDELVSWFEREET